MWIRESDNQCVRASLAEGDLEMAESNWGAAIDAFQRVWNQDSDFFDETLERLRECFQHQEKEEDFIQMLADYSAEKPSTCLFDTTCAADYLYVGYSENVSFGDSP